MATNGVNGAHLSAETAENASGLPPRFQIRKLHEKHIPWASAIVIHSNMFYSPVWPTIYPDHLGRRTLNGYGSADYLVRHQIESGMSFGVFDTEYKYKRPESEKTEGKCYWDDYPEGADPGKEELLDAMDFPLASVALAYDAINPLDLSQMGPMMEVLPLFGPLYGIFHSLDEREASTWEATGPKQVLMRNATSTRHEYEGHGIMAKLARWLMRESKKEGYRGINIECLADQVAHVWSHPPTPYTADIVCRFGVHDWEEKDEKTGQTVYPYRPAKQIATRVYTKLE